MKFGIELEFTAAIANASSAKFGGFYDHVLQLMRESGIKDWRYETDASCGNEIVSPVLDENHKGLQQALQTCHCANMAKEQYGLGRLLGPDCGVHFHYDATDLVKKNRSDVVAIRNVLLLAAILEPLWFSMNPGARFETAFAAPLNFNLFQMVRARDMVDIRDIWFRHYQGVKGHEDSYRIQRTSYAPSFINSERCPDKYDWTRYHGLNLVALWKHGTFEFRYTHGSFEPYNIEMWFNLYKSVVELARGAKTRSIVRACPINIEDIKNNSIKGLHDAVYKNLNLAIDFMFRPKSKMGRPLFSPSVELLKFILKKIIKYNPNCMPSRVASKVWEYDGIDFEVLMGYIKDIVIESVHKRRNRYKFTPMSEPMSSNHGDNLDYLNNAPEDIIDDNYDDEDEPY